MQAVVAALRELPAAIAVSEAGSVRRRKETFRDLDIIASATDPAELTRPLRELNWVVDVAAQGDTKATVVSRDGLRFDLRVVPPESFGNLLQHFTGSKDHNVAMREDAVRRGLSISEYGVTNVETGDVFKSAEEDAVYEFLGYQPIPPELRENSGELEAARRGELPKLVELRDVRGDLHTHSHWSADGKSTLEEMLEAAAARGYEYYAVTDHSHYLRDGRLQAQLEEIEPLRARFPKLTILAGVEANIRSSGEVDVADEDLALLDWVVASVHQAPDSRPTERVLEAMQNPYVDVHRPPHRAADREAAAARRRRRARDRGRARDRHAARDQRPAGPARPAGRARARSEGGGAEAHRLLRRARGPLAGLRRAGGRAGAARLADEGRRRQHAHLEAARQAAEEAALTDFREDGAAALEWAASYLERVGELPVLAQVKPGELTAQLPAAAPEQPEEFADVLRDLDELLLPAMTNWQSPRFFSYFAVTSSEPAILAELLAAAVNQVALVWRASPASTELELRVADWVRQLLGLPEGWHGHIEDTASTSTLAALIAARHVTGTQRRRLLRARALLGGEGRADARDGAAQGAGGRRAADARRRLRPRRRRVCRGDRGHDVVRLGRSGTRARRAGARAGAWLHVDAAYAGSSWICEEERWSADGVELADSLVVNPHKWLLVPTDCSLVWTARPEEWREAFTLTPEYLRTADEAFSLADYGPPLGRRFRSLKLWAVLRCYGAEGLRAIVREHVRLAALFAGWVEESDDWELVAPRRFSLVVFRRRGSDEENEQLLERVNASGEIFINHTKLDGRYVLRLAIGNARTTEDDVRRAWDVLNREAER